MNPFLLDWAVKSAALAALGCLGAGLARRTSAARRQAAWTAMLIGLLCLPAAIALLPPLAVPLMPATPNFAARAGAVPDVRPFADAHAGAALASSASAQGGSETISADAAGGAVWALGALLLLFGLARDHRRAWQIARRARAGRGTRAGRVAIAISGEVHIPQASGILRPVILLPRGFARESRQRRRVILLHELAHVERRDCLWLLAAGVACAVYWWNPLVWAAARAQRRASEEAADDRALSAARRERIGAVDYAQHLVESARCLRERLTASQPAAAMPYISHLEERVLAILDPARPRARLSAGASAALAALLAACLLPLAAARLGAAAPQQAQLPKFEAASVRRSPPISGTRSDEDSDPVHLSMVGTLHRFIIRAYGITEHQIGGEPGWARSEEYSINAVTAGPTTQAQKMLMLRSLLENRFQLKLRQEERSQPVYALEVAPGGPKFRPLKPGEHLPSKPARRPNMIARRFEMIGDLVNSLNGVQGRPLRMDRTVVDRTGLSGRYGMVLSTEVVRDSGARVLRFPNLMADLQMQLGLRLVATHAPLPYYQWVSAARPTGN